MSKSTLPPNFASLDYLTAFCVSTGTYLHKSMLKALVGVEASSPGVGGGDPYNRKDLVKIDVYIWTPVLLLALGLMAYIPRYFWKQWEGKPTLNRLDITDLSIFKQTLRPDNMSNNVDLSFNI